MINPCACLGPQCGEEFCPCVMESQGLERSAEWQAQNSPEAIARVNAELRAVFDEIFEERNRNV
jgi:hypothetical protein